MDLMICMRGEAEQLPFLPEIAELGAGIELGSYGMIGIRSEQDWQRRLEMHQVVRSQFQGSLVIHGPFIGIEFIYVDHLLREAVNRRLDMTFAAAVQLSVRRVVLHSGYTPIHDLLKMQEVWLEQCVGFWHQEIGRWAEAGIEIVLENDFNESPDLLVALVNEVDNPFLGLCLDVGHQNVFSKLDVLEWVRRMGERLYHVHLHDNDAIVDRHWPLGRGTIEFEPIYAAFKQHAPQATISLEVEDKMEIKLNDLRKLTTYFG